jgi:hypothetical protein
MTQTLYLGMPVLAFDKALILSLAHEPGALVFAAGPVLTASVPLLVAGALADGACQAGCLMLPILQRGCSSLEGSQRLKGVTGVRQRLLSVARAPVAWRRSMWQPSGHLIDRAVGGPLEDVRCVLL